MSRIMCTSSPKVKATRKTSRPSAPFGAGLLPKPYRRFEPSDAERKWAAAAFADDASPDYDQLAGEAAFLASYEAMSSCGQAAETLTYGYCNACDDAGTEATINGQNDKAGLGYQVF
jgi:hypothetical protein